MRSCQEVVRLISSDEVDALGIAGRLELRVHLLWCRHCRRYRRQIEALGRVARRAFTGREHADRALEVRILDALDRPGPPAKDT